MFREDIKREMTLAFLHEFGTMLTEVRYERSSKNGVFDPVTETYTGGTDGIDTQVKGIFRKIRSSIQDKMNLTSDDRKFTILQDSITFVPEENDTLDGQWTVLEIDSDPADVFYNLYVRRV